MYSVANIGIISLSLRLSRFHSEYRKPARGIVAAHKLSEELHTSRLALGTYAPRSGTREELVAGQQFGDNLGGVLLDLLAERLGTQLAPFDLGECCPHAPVISTSAMRICLTTE